MVKPPPSQAGKFKPRKPAKKVRIGGGGGEGSPAAAAAAAPSTGRGGRAGRGRGRGGRGGRDGGRGGGRGRGRRAPVAQGQVFFTATAKPIAASKTSTAAASRFGGRGRPGAAPSRPDQVVSGEARAGGRQPQVLQAQEEIVGEIEGYGDTSGKPTSVLSGGRSHEDAALDYMDEDENNEKSNNSSAGNRLAEAFFYSSSDESENSEEEVMSAAAVAARRKKLAAKKRQQERNRRGAGATMEPLVLPFPPSTKPAGIGACSPVVPDATGSVANVQSAPISIDAPLPSPFLDLQSTPESLIRKWEEDGWFLVQLPTRLPPLHPPDDNSQAADNNDDEVQEVATAAASVQTGAQDSAFRVTRAPLQADRFDNSLVRARPGKLGSMVVYESGKTVLELVDDDHSGVVRMDVTEGLTCGFRQEAVSIDTDKNEMVVLGEVLGTMIAIPDLSSTSLSRQQAHDDDDDMSETGVNEKEFLMQV